MALTEPILVRRIPTHPWGNPDDRKYIDFERYSATGGYAALKQAMDRYQVSAADVGLLAHATTVVTNALLEEKGARAAAIMTRWAMPPESSWA